MRLRADQLFGHLERSLAPLYLVTGDEPLQSMEAADAVRTAARRRGFGERQVMHVDPSFDWQALLAAADNLSLFAERRLVELRMPGGKPGDTGAKALTAYVDVPPEDNLLLITCGKLDRSQQQSKWFKALEAAGVVVQVWPVDHQALPGWVERRMRSRGVAPDPEAARLLAERVEGNLLAAAQEIEKLLLLYGEGPLSAEAVGAAVADSTRYDLFQLVDTALAGEAGRVVRMVEGLRAEGVEPVLILWGLTREVRTLAGLAQAVAAGRPVERALVEARVWDKRKGAVRAALKRYRSGHWRRLLRRAGQADRIAKGAERGNIWDELLQLALLIAGARTV